MPNNSCRTCGGDLIRWSTCTDCRKITQKICKVCCEKTAEDFHSHHIHLEPYNIVERKEVLSTVHSYQELVPAKSPRKKHTVENGKTILVICCIIGIVILGISITNYVESLYSPSQSIVQPISPPHQGDPLLESPEVSQPSSDSAHTSTVRSNEETKHTYSNCLGVSNGIQLTVTCPTSNGITYKAVVKIPSELIVQLESDIFNLREIYVTEHTDSISIQYAKKTYEAKFVNG